MLILITGATSGFGWDLALRYAQNGHRVIATGRRQNKLDELKAVGGDNIYPLALDVSVAAAVNDFMAQLPPEWREIDVLINNAGLALGLEPAQNASMDDWRRMIDVNINGLVHMTHVVLPGMVERNRGHIINLGSTAGSWPYAGGNVYGASKAFVHQFSLNLRTDLFGTAVRVTNVEPGLVGGTEFSNVRFKGDEGRVEQTYENTQPLMPSDITEAIWWISNLPAHVNINTLEMMPVCQSYGGLRVAKGE
ncbi:bifunctional NADP-dependent 3-hydroxy acid dehydrogenase/3-hydroxypropionate dehydrogenase YdfG [Pantoea rwandensis]|uniref:NADP-dependent 3-hydroxy acid dehydrogenase n=1 Tax=Pantoea rwandensis TaxID=1076550 RepID=A0A1X1D3A4_9GAMM|nr:bifunctional NADP-dependent 3-hydroxy acid dehydrogenase/3-hydroxypropionate dehydrogenase YdfG [Pantoea rwandensis]ORM71158.1 NADP-dependent 3-hydroxy acid dehydrogenase [Pantoea rwandensis]